MLVLIVAALVTLACLALMLATFVRMWTTAAQVCADIRARGDHYRRTHHRHLHP